MGGELAGSPSPPLSLADVAHDGLAATGATMPAAKRASGEPCRFCGRRLRSVVALQAHVREKHWAEPGLLEALSPAARLLGVKLHIVVEDDWLAVVVKPQGCPTQGPGSLARADWLLRQLRPSSAGDALRQPRPAHRLDAGTGGLLVLAKTAGALRSLCASFAEGRVQKRYRALVCGRVGLGEEGSCDTPLYGKPCLTRFRSIRPPVQTAEGWVSTLDLWPFSGRRHQIRRHLRFLGWPVLGDERYGFGYPEVDDTEAAAGEKQQQEEDAGETTRPFFLWALEFSSPHPAAPSDEGAIDQAGVEAEAEVRAETNAKEWVTPPRHLHAFVEEPVTWRAFLEESEAMPVASPAAASGVTE
mmetsp:Transcript_57194/g.129319  ORF Transcript_57194/g.129319 Transcript_57194/m.129319 type:complete len:358 (+) Transcript_57194:37-1110(+)